MKRTLVVALALSAVVARAGELLTYFRPDEPISAQANAAQEFARKRSLLVNACVKQTFAHVNWNSLSDEQLTVTVDGKSYVLSPQTLPANSDPAFVNWSGYAKGDPDDEEILLTLIVVGGQVGGNLSLGRNRLVAIYPAGRGTVVVTEGSGNKYRAKPGNDVMEPIENPAPCPADR